MPHSPEAQAQIEAFEAAKRARAERGVVHAQPLPGREFVLSAVRPGWPIYSRTRTDHTGEFPLGGIVVEVLHSSRTDAETGEIAEATVYRCLDQWKAEPPPYQWLDAAEVDTSQVPGVNRARAAAGCYWLLDRVPHTRRVIHPREVDYLRDAWTLAVASAGL
jgi:hypothetical protein